MNRSRECVTVGTDRCIWLCNFQQQITGLVSSITQCVMHGRPKKDPGRRVHRPFLAHLNRIKKRDGGYLSSTVALSLLSLSVARHLWTVTGKQPSSETN